MMEQDLDTPPIESQLTSPLIDANELGADTGPFRDSGGDFVSMASDFTQVDVPDDDSVVGGIRVSRLSLSPQYIKRLPPYTSFQLRVWRILNGPLEPQDVRGRVLNGIFQVTH